MPGKSQKQRAVEVRMLNDLIGEGVATGNNAAWLCGCGYGLPLVGTTLHATPVVCKECGTKYYLRPQGNNGSPVDYVEEA